MSIKDAMATMVAILEELRKLHPQGSDDQQEYEAALGRASDVADASAPTLVAQLGGGVLDSLRANFELPPGLRVVVVDYDEFDGIEKRLTVAIETTIATNYPKVLA